MSDILFALINDPIMAFMLGISVGFWARHIFAKNNQKLEKKKRDLDEIIIKEITKENWVEKIEDQTMRKKH
jgi:hypothetical protein